LKAENSNVHFLENRIFSIGDAINPAFASDLENLILEFQPELWIHGHIHTACDYTIGKTRVICNPRGYPSELNTGFIPEKVVEI